MEFIMSPLTIERIKKAKGQVRIVPLDGNPNSTIDVERFSVQILENGAWVNVYTDTDRNLCEQAVRQATSKVILG
jgi:hypothetical protein